MVVLVTAVAAAGAAYIATGGLATPVLAAPVAATTATGGTATATTGVAASLTYNTATGVVHVACALGPWGCAVVGNVGATFDCWKSLVHDASPEPSCGIRLCDLVHDSRIRQVDITPATVHNDSSPSSSLPQIVFHNIWDERFRLEYVLMPSGETAGHLVQF